MGGFKVIIIGGGLAGSLLANGLIKEGVECQVYERDVRGSNREGYQIRLGAAALAGFRECLDSAQLQAIVNKFGRSGGLKSAAPILYDAQMICVLDLTKFPSYTKSAPINRVVLRNFLQEPVYQAGRLHFEKKFVRYEILRGLEGTDKVRVDFEDGSYDEGDLLISAEGSYSKVNTQVGLDNIVQLHKKWGFLAKGSLPSEKLQSLTPLLQKGPVACSVDGNVLFCSAYLPDAFDQANKKVVGYDENLASLFWGLSVPAAAVAGDARDLEDKLQFCIDKTKDWNPAYHEIMRALDKDDIYTFQGRASTKPPVDWRRKAAVEEDPGRGHPRIWLVGDAIHPMLPSRGMGGNQALHDAADALMAVRSLNLSTRSNLPSEHDMETAVDIYETKMIPRAFGWVQQSGGLGGSDPPDSQRLRGKITILFFSVILSLASAFQSVRTFFGYKPVDDAPEFL